MKKFLILFAVVALLATPAFAQLGPAGGNSGWQQFKTVTAGVSAQTVFSSAGTSTTVGSTYNVTNATSCKVTFLSTSTSSANLDLEESPDGVTYWHRVVRVANPTGPSGGEIWTGPCGPYLRFNPSTHASGTLKGYIQYRTMSADPLGSVWKQVEVADAGSTFSLTTPTFATSMTLQQTTANYTLVWSNPGSARTITVPDPGGADSFVFVAATQTLTNKTLTSPTFTAPVLGAATGTSVALSGNATANHYKATVTVPPTVTGGASTCGSTAAAIVGGDAGGTVTVGSVGGTACVITFGGTYTNLPACTITRYGVAAGDLVVTRGATTLTATATFGAGETFGFTCVGF